MSSFAGNRSTVRVGRLSDIPEGRGIRFRIGEHDIALWHLQGRLYALANTCPHQHIPALFSGTLEDHCVTCPMHGWSFSLETGAAVTGSGRVHVYPVRENGGWVEVSLPSDQASVWGTG